MVDDDREGELNAHSSLDEMLARETFGRSSSVGDDEIGDEAAWEFESDDESDDDDESRRRQLIQR